MNRSFKRVASALLVFCGGCATGEAAPPVRTEAADPSTSRLVASSDRTESARAEVALSAIQPAVEKPAPGAPIEPLSERSAARVTRARELIVEDRFTEAALELERALRYQADHPDIHLALAQLHWQARNIARSRTHAEKVLQARPDDPQAHYLLGRAHQADDDRLAALEAYRTARACLKNDVEPAFAARLAWQLAEVLAEEGYLRAAVEQYSEFEARAAQVNADSTDRETATLLKATGGRAGLPKAVLLERLGEYAPAADAMRVVADQHPDDVQVAERFIRLLIRAGRFDESAERARMIQRDHATAVALLLEVYTAAGDPGQLLPDLEKRLDQAPDDAELVLLASRTLDQLDQPQRAGQVLDEFLQAHPEADAVRLELLEQLIRRAQWPALLDQAALLMTSAPSQAGRVEELVLSLSDRPEAVRAIVEHEGGGEAASVSAYLRGRLAQAAGRSELAEELFRESRSADPAFSAATVALATFHFDAYRYDEALQILGAGDPDSPSDAGREMILGRIHERLDRVDDAERHFKRVLVLEPGNTDAMMALALLYADHQQPLNAQRQLRALLERDPGHEAAREKLALLYLEENRADAAVGEFRLLKEAAVSPNPKARATAFLAQYPRFDAENYRKTLMETLGNAKPDATSWLAVGETYNEISEAQERSEAFRKAAAADPTSEKAAIGLIEVFKRELDFEQATEQMQELLRRRPNRHLWRLALVDLYWTQADYDAALAVIDRGLADENISADVRGRYQVFALDTLRLADRLGEAIDRCAAWAESSDDKIGWARRQARLYRLNEQPERAIALLEPLRSETPGNDELRSDLIDAYLAAREYDRASQVVLDWLATDPEDDNAVHRLVLVLSGAERFDAAIELVKNTLVRTAHREVFQDLLAGIYAQARRYDRAIEWVNDLLDETTTLGDEMREGRPRPADETLAERRRITRPDDPVSAASLAGRVKELHVLVTRLMALGGKHREARIMLEDWLSTARDPAMRYEYLRNVALTYQMEGDDLSATERLAQALLISPDDVGLSNDVAYGWIDRSMNLEQAERLIRFALWRNPREGAYLDTYGWLMYKKGNFEEARKWLSRASHARGDDDPVVLDHLADALWRLGSKEEAIQAWERAVAALEEMDEESLISADLKRAHVEVPLKLQAAAEKGEPPVAPLAAESQTRQPAEPRNAMEKEHSGR